jgi:hypothetical protein
MRERTVADGQIYMVRRRSLSLTDHHNHLFDNEIRSSPIWHDSCSHTSSTLTKNRCPLTGFLER